MKKHKSFRMLPEGIGTGGQYINEIITAAVDAYEAGTGYDEALSKLMETMEFLKFMFPNADDRRAFVHEQIVNASNHRRGITK